MNEEEFTKEDSIEGKNVGTYLDYFIIHGIKDYFFLSTSFDKQKN